MEFNLDQLLELESRFRATLMNTIAGARPAVLVGTRSAEGHSNLAIFNSLMHIGASPPLIGLLFRPATVERHTLSNILQQKEYSLNFIHSSMARQAHQTSAKFPSSVSEFSSCGFNEANFPGSLCPYVTNALIRLRMKFEQRLDIALNGTILIIGSVQYVYVDDTILSTTGFTDHETGSVLHSIGLDAYCRISDSLRFCYAQPDQTPQEIEK